jgi:hypothetical protein
MDVTIDTAILLLIAAELAFIYFKISGGRE